MMKKLRMLVILIILAFSFSVKAEVMLEIDCDNYEITSDKSVSCEADLLYETEGVTDIEFNYQTNLDIKFHAEDGFILNASNGKITIHTDEALYDEIMNSEVIMTFTLSSNSNSLEKETLSFNNFKVNKSDEIEVEDVLEEFTIIKEKEEIKLDSVCTLDSITIEKELIKDFDKDKLEYHGINVTKEVVFIDAVRTSDKSSATGLGDVRIPNGETIERDIIVTAEDDTRKVYKLFITNTTPKLVEKSKDNTLKNIEIYNNKDKINFKFDNTKDTFNIKIDDMIGDKLTIKATLNDSKASFMKNYGPRDIKIDYGSNKILIKVKAENNDEKTYTINIDYPDNRDKDNTLLSLKINDKEVNLEDLMVTLPNETSKTKIEAVTNSDKASVLFEDIELIEGENLVKIVVTAENGDSKEYLIRVIKEEKIEILPDKEDNKIIEDNPSYLVYYIIGGVVLLVILILIYYIKRGKKNQKNEVIEEI